MSVAVNRFFPVLCGDPSDCTMICLLNTGCQPASVCVPNTPPRAGVYPAGRRPGVVKRPGLHPHQATEAAGSQQNPGTSPVAV